MSNSRWRGAGVLSVAAVLALSTTADAQQRRKDQPRQVPETGVEEQAPTTPESVAAEQTLDRMINRSSEGLVEVAQPDGTVFVDLQGRFMSVMMATTDANGKAIVACHASHDTLAPPDASHATHVAKPAPAAAPTTTSAREIK